MLLVSLPLLLINESINQWESLHRDEMNQQNTKECNVKKKKQTPQIRFTGQNMSFLGNDIASWAVS